MKTEPSISRPLVIVSTIVTLVVVLHLISILNGG